MAETSLFGLKINLPDFGKKEQNQAAAGEDFSEEELKNFTPNIPHVNLLPPSITERYAVERLRNKFLAAALGVLVFLGIGYGGTMILESQAENRLSELEQETMALNSELQELSVYKVYVDEVDAKRATLFDQFTGAIQYANLARWVQSAADENDVMISDFSFGSTEGSGSSCASPDPFNPSSAIGCITLNATAEDVQAVVGFTESLNENPAFINPYFPTVTLAENGVTMNGSVAYTAEATTVPYPDMAVGILEALDPATNQETEDPSDEALLLPEDIELSDNEDNAEAGGE